jgi:TolA-binding protein
MKDNSVIITLLLVLLTAASIGVTAYATTQFIKHTTSQSSYKRQVDSLNTLIQANTRKVAALDSNTKLEQQKIKQLQLKLSDLSYRTNKNLQRYEEQLDRLNRLTDSQLVIKFSDIFDYD